MPVFADRVKMTTTTTGTGTLTLGSALSGYQSFAEAGVPDGGEVRYVIESTGNIWEIGLGTYAASGTTLTRGARESSSGGAAISLSGVSIVYVTVAAVDLAASTMTPLMFYLGQI